MTDHVERLKLAIVGCGAAAYRCYLPALAEADTFALAAVIDADASRAEGYAAAFGAARYGATGRGDQPEVVGSDIGAAVRTADAALIVTASDAHVDVATRFLRAGKHTLIEKPLALDSAGCQLLLEAAGAGGAVIRPALVRRLFPVASWVRSRLADGRLGAVRRVRWAEGAPYDWPVATTAMFRRSQGGGGLLMDSGPHVLDLLCYWFGPAELLRHRDNSRSGSDSEMLTLLGFGGVTAEVELSRLRTLAGSCLIEAANGSLTISTTFPGTYTERDRAGRVVASGNIPVVPPARTSWTGLFTAQLADFADVIGGGQGSLATFADGSAVVRLIEECVREADHDLPRPWQALAGTAGGGGTRVAVTGGSGFIGSHVVERLLADGQPTTAVVRDLARLARLAHLDQERLRFAQADIRDRQALRAAFDGCEVVVHTVFGKDGTPEEQANVTVDGTAATIEAARQAGVRRLVILSTVAVYDPAGRVVIDEDCPVIAQAGGLADYARQKLAAEQLALAAAGDGLQVICLQPTVVYGPWAPAWTMTPLRKLRTAPASLPGGPWPAGTCNAVHVHDVADAVVTAALRPDISQGRYLVSGPKPVSWGAFYDAYRLMLGVPPSGDPGTPLDDWERRLYDDHAVVSSARLAEAGFSPSIDLEAGMAQVAAWATWAGLLS